VASLQAGRAVRLSLIETSSLKDSIANLAASGLQDSTASLVLPGSVATCLAASAEFAGRVMLSSLSLAAAPVELAADSQELERAQRPNREPLLQTAGAGVSWTLLGAFPGVIIHPYRNTTPIFLRIRCLPSEIGFLDRS
jgi:hypothetical protein